MNTSICSRLKNVSIFFLALTCCVTQPSLADTVVPGEEGPASFEALGIVIPEPAPNRNETEGEGSVSYTVKDGVVYDAKALLPDIRDMVTAARDSEARQGSAQ